MKNVIKILLSLLFLVVPYLCLASSTTTDDFLYFKNEVEKIKENQIRNYDRLNTIDKEKIPDLDNRLNDYSFEKESIDNLIKVVASEQRVANEKENAYDKAINQIKWWISGLSAIVIISLTIFGYLRNKEIVSVKKEIKEDLDDFKEKIKNNIESKFLKENVELESIIFRKIENYENEDRIRFDRIDDKIFKILLGKAIENNNSEEENETENSYENLDNSENKDIDKKDPFDEK